MKKERLTQKQAFKDLRAYISGEYGYSNIVLKYNIVGSFLNTFDRLISEDNFNCKKVASVLIRGENIW